MKAFRISLLIALLISIATPHMAFAQSDADYEVAMPQYSVKQLAAPQATSDEYMRRSRRLLTGGIISASVGAACWIGGTIALFAAASENGSANVAIFGLCGLAGTTGLALSIPLFISSAHYRHKAKTTASISLTADIIQSPSPSGAFTQTPSVGLAIKF